MDARLRGHDGMRRRVWVVGISLSEVALRKPIEPMVSRTRHRLSVSVSWFPANVGMWHPGPPRLNPYGLTPARETY